MWNLPPPLGFQPLRDDIPIAQYEQHLPHWRQNGATYFVTFRLADSLPQTKLRELRQFKADWLRKHPPPRSRDSLDGLAEEMMRRVENWLDKGMGDCILKASDVVALVCDALHQHDGVDHELGCYVVMPNHVHLISRPLTPETVPLETILQFSKGSSARNINLLLDQTETVWQRESFDRIIRDAEHLYRDVQYIGRNPAKARLRDGIARLWISPSWIQQGWNFETVIAGRPKRA